MELLHNIDQLYFWLICFRIFQTSIATMIGMAVNFGMHGTIVWGFSSTLATEEGCRDLHDNLNNIVGPYLRKLINLANKCSDSNCNSNGRCSDSRFTSGAFRKMKQVNIIRRLKSPFNNAKFILCNCYPGWSGTNCEKSS